MRRENRTTVKVCIFLGYDTVQIGGCVRTFRRKMLSVSSGVNCSVKVGPHL